MSDVDHKALIAGLSSAERATLTERTNVNGLVHFTAHAGAICVGATLILLKVPLWPLIMVGQGVLICFLFTALHETTHRTPFKTDTLNVWVGRICGALVLLGSDWFRYFHLAHHRYTHDPELASPKPETRLEYVIYLSGVPETFARITTLIRNATRENQDSYVPERAKARMMKEAQVLLVIYAGIAGLSVMLWTPVVLYVWILPFLLGGPFLRGYLLAEHARCPHVASMLDNTRTTLTTRLVRALAWNMPYHAEHHAYPAVPFHKLPAFHAHTKPHISHLENGYLGFNRRYLKDSGGGRDPL